MRPQRRYLLVSPCRDEAKFMRRTLDSVAARSKPHGDGHAAERTLAVIHRFLA
jgi:hypothetical protein